MVMECLTFSSSRTESIRTNPNDATPDRDGDGFTNLQECLAGTNSNVPARSIGITDATELGSDVAISFSSVLGKTYQVESSDVFPTAAWNIVANNIPGTGGLKQITDAGGGNQSKRFYRVSILPLEIHSFSTSE